MKFQPVKGTIDFYPQEKETHNYLAGKFRDTAIKYGFSEIETPAFENLTTLCEKEGEEIKQQIFVLEKRSNEQLGLRFDITVPCARMFVQKQKELPKPTKWFYITRMWRYEQPQKGRLREFYQYGVELFGSDKIDADAQIISLVIDSFISLGLTEKDFVIKINNRDLLEGLLEDMKIKNAAEVITIIDKIAKLSEKQFIEELEKTGISQTTIIILDKMLRSKELSAIKPNCEKARLGLEKIKSLFELLKDKKEYIQFDLSCARGLAYYTGTVFEGYDREGKYRALCGGGRYDKMIEMFGGNAESACGFGVGFATVELLLHDKMLCPDSNLGVDYYIATMDNEAKEFAIKTAQKLREKGYRVDTDVMGRAFKKQTEYAQKIGAKNLIVIGENEVKSGSVKAKNLIDGKETVIKV